MGDTDFLCLILWLMLSKFYTTLFIFMLCDIMIKIKILW